MTENAMKLCKDCKHCRPHIGSVLWFKQARYEYAKCAQTMDPVSGQPAEFCEFKRSPGGACGPNAKLWEA